ncbi:hypothetical protein ASPCAL06922 [Aspergillus calidoustus]|uniref:CCHC-type domain-containing protein n=1 Tax=Aspergillus calidoustus TaxID=454130 RepID=A0A0U5G233_ASPCI|nr:hypothetical protein ASPCAL06922 [Aspergillus calidoustus]
MVGGTIWPVLGIQPLNHPEHAAQIIAEATALLELDSTKRAKLPAQSLEAFLNSVITLAKKTREQPSGQEILGKLNSLQPIIEDITLIKNAVNNVIASPTPLAPNAAARINTWADVVRSGTPSYPSTPNSRASTAASVKDRETIVKLDANAAAILRKISPEEIRKRVNDALGSRISLLGTAPRVIAAKQLKSGDVVLHTATTAESDNLKSAEDEWVKVLGTTAKVIKPTYGVLVHGVRTSKESIDTDNQQRATEKIESENSVLHEGAKVSYVEWLTKEGRRKPTSSLIVEFTTKYHANRAIREGLVLNAIHHDCVLYDRSCRLKQCYRCHEYGHIGLQCDAEERCGYCAGMHNTKECMAKETDPKPTPKCALCKGEHTAWSNACPRRRREQARIELARKTRPTFHYESDEPRPTTLKTPASRNGGEASVLIEGGSGAVALTSTPTASVSPSQSHPYDLRRNIQPSTRLVEGEWQTHRRRRTRSPQKSSQRDRSRSPGVRQTPRLSLRSKQPNSCYAQGSLGNLELYAGRK